jgi:hypothetical protein
VDKKERLTEEEQFEASASDTDGLIDSENASASKKKKSRSRLFTNEELDAMPSYTQKELEALPEPWTKRGEMISSDKSVIQGLVERNRVAARIFVTGEVDEDYIGETAVKFLIGANDIYYKNKAGREPLFINTRGGTVRMSRFDPRFVWRCFHPDILVGLVRDEIDRLGVDMDPWKMDYFDFYQNMAAAVKDVYGEDIILMKARSGVDDFYYGVYFACLLLFGKPGYMDVPVAEHFAQKEAAVFLRTAVFLRLEEPEREKLKRLRKEYGNIHALTNPEMHFAVDLYERVVKCG